MLQAAARRSAVGLRYDDHATTFPTRHSDEYAILLLPCSHFLLSYWGLHAVRYTQPTALQCVYLKVWATHVEVQVQSLVLGRIRQARLRALRSGSLITP